MDLVLYFPSVDAWTQNNVKGRKSFWMNEDELI